MHAALDLVAFEALPVDVESLVCDMAASLPFKRLATRIGTHADQTDVAITLCDLV